MSARRPIREVGAALSILISPQSGLRDMMAHVTAQKWTRLLALGAFIPLARRCPIKPAQRTNDPASSCQGGSEFTPTTPLVATESSKGPKP